MNHLFSFFIVFATVWSSVLAVNGDIACKNGMCVTAIVHSNSTTTYDLTVSNSQVGWMSIGFGSTMINAPMVILWRDSSNGNTIISQRSASSYDGLTIVTSPPRVASAVNSRASFNSTAQTLSFSIPSNSDIRQTIIYAWSSTAPSSNSPDASIVEHDDKGTMSLNLVNQLPSFYDEVGSNSTTTIPTSGGSTSDSGSNTNSGSNSGSSNNIAIPLTPSQKVLAAHGIILTIAFLIILPLGALQARLFRTIIPGKIWFGLHWILQWPVAALLMIIGLILGVVETHKLKLPDSNHKTVGVILTALYVIQCVYGGIIHFVKPARPNGRPPQNYGHAILGILVIGLSFKQVHNGLDDEWPRIGGPAIPQSIWTWWKVWIITIPLLYLFGLVLLPRQYRLERDQRAKGQYTAPVELREPR